MTSGVINTKSFGKEVRKALIDADMNQSRLAELLGVTTAYVSAVLTGVKRPNPSFFEALERHGLVNQTIRLHYIRERGFVDVSMLSVEQVAQLLEFVNRLGSESSRGTA